METTDLSIMLKSFFQMNHKELLIKHLGLAKGSLLWWYQKTEDRKYLQLIEHIENVLFE